MDINQRKAELIEQIKITRDEIKDLNKCLNELDKEINSIDNEKDLDELEELIPLIDIY